MSSQREPDASAPLFVRKKATFSINMSGGESDSDSTNEEKKRHQDEEALENPGPLPDQDVMSKRSLRRNSISLPEINSIQMNALQKIHEEMENSSQQQQQQQQQELVSVCSSDWVAGDNKYRHDD